MTSEQFTAEMLLLAISQAKLLCELPELEDIKIEPEQQLSQLRQNISSILSLLHDTEDLIKSLSVKNTCSALN